MTTRKARHTNPDLAGRGISAAPGFAGPFPPPRPAVARSPGHNHKRRNPTTNRDRNSLRTTTDIHAICDSRSSPGIHAGSGSRERGSRVDHHESPLDQVDGSQADGKTNGKNDRSRSRRVGQRTRPRALPKRVQKTPAPRSRRRDRQMPWPDHHHRLRDAVPGLESAPATQRTPQRITGDAYRHYKPRCGT